MEFISGNETLHNKQTERKQLSTTAKLLLACTGGIGLGITIVCGSFVAPAFRKICLPYVPATTEQIGNVLKFLPKNNSSKLLDIGSGDGRIVIAAAKHGLHAEGVELNPWLVYFSRLSAFRMGVSKQTRFFCKDLWKFNIKSYNYVVIFGVEQMMKDIEKKLVAEATDAKVIACRFPMPHLKPESIIEDGVNTVWFYDLNKK
ncbi:ATP synthase subunit C lysine N-methyltransferase [Teleopsis dalmanni]|uniref:ATP synthase subunit C lysine N-methyltransferase n=1 Tax=Teleopsis dalmanni TaxID=139649 RepID=UPI0018CD496F|nr:ATP synthase subunit C lysine N-methyltransferase [Teleopsis dalmanni]